MVNLVMSNSLKNNNFFTNEGEKDDIFSDIHYICRSTPLIVDSLQKGLDVA